MRDGRGELNEGGKGGGMQPQAAEGARCSTHGMPPSTNRSSACINGGTRTDRGSAGINGGTASKDGGELTCSAQRHPDDAVRRAQKERPEPLLLPATHPSDLSSAHRTAHVQTPMVGESVCGGGELPALCTRARPRRPHTADSEHAMPPFSSTCPPLPPGPQPP